MLRGLSRIKTIRVRLIAYSVGLFGLTLLLFCAFLLRVFTTSSEKEFDTDLYNYSVDIAYGLDVNLFGRFTLSRNLLGRGEKIFPFELGETMI